MNRAVLRSLVPALLLAACGAAPPPGHQGYVEGEYVTVASSQPGRLARLAVQRGQRVAADAPLFELEAVEETAQRRQAEQQLRAAEAQLADLQSGRRREEADVVRAQLAQAQVEQARAATQAARDEAQWHAGGLSQAQSEQAQAAAATAAQRVRELQAQLSVASLPGRDAQRRAQAAQVEAARAALEQAQWRLDQKRARARQPGLVTDTLYREGEWVAAGQPVLRLLPPANLKARFFVPQSALAALAPGRAVALHCDGCPAPIAAVVSHVSPQAEYTPPVIYSNDTRARLVFMVEAKPLDAAAAASLQPGQPVTVEPR